MFRGEGIHQKKNIRRLFSSFSGSIKKRGDSLQKRYKKMTPHLSNLPIRYRYQQIIQSPLINSYTRPTRKYDSVNSNEQNLRRSTLPNTLNIPLKKEPISNFTVCKTLTP